MNILKHVGKNKNTGTRVAIVFMQIPDDPKSCLVVDMDSLTDSLKIELNDIINSKEAQKATQLFEILDRTHYRDGKSYLHVLHTFRNLTKLSTDDVIISPDSQHSIVLTDLNTMIHKINHGTDKFTDDELSEARSIKKSQFQEAEKEQVRSVARGIINQAIEFEAQATYLLEDAKKKRIQANAMLNNIGEGTTVKPVAITEDEPAPQKRKYTKAKNAK